VLSVVGVLLAAVLFRLCVTAGGGMLAAAAGVLTVLFRLFAREGFLEGGAILAVFFRLLGDISEQK
jgi:hypothetical protein